MEGVAPAPSIRQLVRAGRDMKPDKIRGRPPPENGRARRSRGGEARPKHFSNSSAAAHSPSRLGAQVPYQGSLEAAAKLSVSEAAALDDRHWFADHPDRLFRARAGSGGLWLIRRRPQGTDFDAYLRAFSRSIDRVPGSPVQVVVGDHLQRSDDIVDRRLGITGDGVRMAVDRAIRLADGDFV